MKSWTLSTVSCVPHQIQPPLQALAMRTRRAFERLASELSIDYPYIPEQCQFGEYATSCYPLYSWLAIRDGAVVLSAQVANDNGTFVFTCCILSDDGVVFAESDPVAVGSALENLELSDACTFVEDYFAARKGIVETEMLK